MLVLPAGRVEFDEGVTFRFPTSLCCNCARKDDLSVISQDTRQTLYLGLGGTELSFPLPLPFCSGCARSARRRPKTFIHWLLIFFAVFGVAVLGLIILAQTAFADSQLGEYVVHIAFGVAVLVVALMLRLRRPRGAQTSYSQPVRIHKLKRKFVSGRVTRIVFAFSNEEYAQAFIRENAQAIQQDHVEVVPW